MIDAHGFASKIRRLRDKSRWDRALDGYARLNDEARRNEHVTQ